MPRDKTLPIRDLLRKMLPAAVITRLARETGAVQRRRKVDMTALIWTLVLGFAAGRRRSLALLRRQYERVAGHPIEESSFYDRFNPGLVKLLRRAAAYLMRPGAEVGRALRGPLAAFADVMITDSTVVRLHDLLAKAFPACRTNHTQAALKAHVVLSVRGRGDHSLKVTSERTHDGPVLRVGPWVKDRLLLFDLGYFRYQLFACITRNGGYFLTRLKGHANPLIVAQHRVHRGRARKLVGERLRDVVHGLKRQVLDIEVSVRFPRRVYAGRVHRATQTLRVVGIYDERSREHHLYITNIPVEKLAAEDIAATYALRWQVELLFKELKAHYRLEDMPSRKRVVVEALLFAAILTLLVSRRLLAAARARLAASHVPEHRWASIFCAYAHDLLLIVRASVMVAAPLSTAVGRALLHEAADPNRKRRGLLGDVENRTHALNRIRQ